MSWTDIYETTDIDGDRLDVQRNRPDGDRLTFTATGRTGRSAAVYVSRASLLEALGASSDEDRTSPEEPCKEETDDELFARLIDRDEAALLTAARALLDPTGLGRVPAHDVIEVASYIKKATD